MNKEKFDFIKDKKRREIKDKLSKRALDNLQTKTKMLLQNLKLARKKIWKKFEK
jgi:hypothetical protein